MCDSEARNNHGKKCTPKWFHERTSLWDQDSKKQEEESMKTGGTKIINICFEPDTTRTFTPHQVYVDISSRHFPFWQKEGRKEYQVHVRDEGPTGSCFVSYCQFHKSSWIYESLLGQRQNFWINHRVESSITEYKSDCSMYGNIII